MNALKNRIMNNNFALCVGRQLGSGGREIGEKLAARLGIAFYDKELINLASKESGLGKEFFEEADEKVNYSLYGGLFGMRASLVDEIYSGYYLSNETLFTIQSNVIRNLAETESCLFVGRCADYVLKEHPRCLSVFITANEADRIARVARNQNLSESKAKDLIHKTDKKRANYYNYFSDREWGVAQTYQLTINSSVLGIDGTVDLLASWVGLKFPKTT